MPLQVVLNPHSSSVDFFRLFLSHQHAAQGVQNVDRCLLVSGTDCLMLQLTHLFAPATLMHPSCTVICILGCQPEEHFTPLWLGNTISYLIFTEEYLGHPWITSPSTVAVVWGCHFRASPNIWGHTDMCPSPGCCMNHFKGSMHSDIHRCPDCHLIFWALLPSLLAFLPSAQVLDIWPVNGEIHNYTAIWDRTKALMWL